MARLPLPPHPATLRELLRPADDVVSLAPTTRIARIFNARGAHSQFWNAFRYTGPLPHAPFDPEPPTVEGAPSSDSGIGVLYFGLTVRTSVAEVFQINLTVDRITKGPHLVVLRPKRTLRLLDLTGSWPSRADVPQQIAGGPKAISQQWARNIHAAYPELDGLWYRSSMDEGEPAVCLWNPPSAEALPERPDFLTPLNHPGLDVPLGRICEQLNYVLLS